MLSFWLTMEGQAIEGDKLPTCKLDEAKTPLTGLSALFLNIYIIVAGSCGVKYAITHLADLEIQPNFQVIALPFAFFTPLLPFLLVKQLQIIFASTYDYFVPCDGVDIDSPIYVAGDHNE